MSIPGAPVPSWCCYSLDAVRDGTRVSWSTECWAVGVLPLLCQGQDFRMVLLVPGGMWASRSCCSNFSVQSSAVLWNGFRLCESRIGLRRWWDRIFLKISCSCSLRPWEGWGRSFHERSEKMIEPWIEHPHWMWGQISADFLKRSMNTSSWCL